MRTFILLLTACLLQIACLNAQDFVQPIKREPSRIKTTKREMKDNNRGRREMKELDYQHFKLAVNAGYGDHTYSMTEKIPSPLTEYVKDLQSGSVFGMDVFYFPVEQVGFGMKYSGYNGRSSKAIFTSASKYSTSDKDLSIQFVGPCISTRLLHADMRNALYFNLACGYVDYRVNYQADVDFSAKGNTIATVYDLGYDLGLTQNVGIGFQISYFRGILEEYQRTLMDDTRVVHLENGKFERLHRLDFSIGLKLNL